MKYDRNETRGRCYLRATVVQVSADENGDDAGEAALLFISTAET